MKIQKLFEIACERVLTSPDQGVMRAAIQEVKDLQRLVGSITEKPYEPCMGCGCNTIYDLEREPQENRFYVCKRCCDVYA